MMKLTRAALLTTLVLTLSSCTSTVSLEAAPDANNPACADVIVRLPDSIGEFAKRQTNAQSTGAWGEPSAIILRCGLEPVYASTLSCVTSNGVDWLVDQSQAPNYRFITFGRAPATEVIVDSKRVSGASALDEVADAIKYIEATASCQLPD